MAEHVSIKIQLNSAPIAAPNAQQNSIDKVLAPKPPFDIRKIAAAVLFLLLLIGGVIAQFWPAPSNALAAQTASSEPVHLAETVTTENLDSEATQPKQEPETSFEIQKNTQAKQTVQTSEIEQVAEKQTSAQQPSDTLSANNIEQPAIQAIVELEPATSTSAETENKLNLRTDEALANEAITDEPQHPVTTSAEPATPALSEQPVTTAEQANWFTEQLPRAQLTSAIKQREPVDSLTVVKLDQQSKIYLFSELRNMQDQQIQVHWYQDERLRASVDLAIGGQRWRTNSSKQFDKHSRGHWRVAIFNQQQQLIFEQNFVVE
ncbi:MULTISPECIES: DUF2914 domain-containing protein [unclassified Agarivorans]|uniref:DUF2914 domain-containing protein n=1 Tax=unclassified Agarivorans TaxID=2636026 RepID=UPI0026E3E108|nr:MULTISPECIES: DUF2914 domain-containing protein [unclassified Agarivorans]MDO6685682.1 DUF2914 domain-containing protein [Agarivorans sp. 3_MG-2023]MDO6716203.1 DUF2914 domain-containing protein [Agarivorans sp. 2_MG-2023]